jgi:hypothetical protein
MPAHTTLYKQQMPLAHSANGIIKNNTVTILKVASPVQ